MKKPLRLFVVVLLIAACKDDDQGIPISPVPPEEHSTSLLEVDGFGSDLSFAIATFQSADTIIKRSLEVPDTSIYLTAILDNVPQGEYTLTLSFFEGDDMMEQTAYRDWHRGKESITSIMIEDTESSFFVKGPEGNGVGYHLEPDWSSRYFQSYFHEDVPKMTLSFPQELCVFDIRMIPTYLERQPEYSYIDYYVYNTGQTELVGVQECFGTCDIIEQINHFGSTIDEDKQALCNGQNWELIDTYIMLNFGDSFHERVIFYQRWIAGEVVVI